VNLLLSSTLMDLVLWPFANPPYITLTTSPFSASGVEHDALRCASAGTQVSTQENDLSSFLNWPVLVYFVDFNGVSHVSFASSFRSRSIS
jgi:hypothetical protein